MELKSKFDIVRSTDEYLFIVDSGCDTRTVTNDAANVVRFLTDNYNLGGRRLIYRDSSGQIDEIVHQNGLFIKFAPGYKGITDDFDNL